MSRLFLLKNKAAVRGVIAAVMLLMFVAILLTLIVNPKALNPDKNQVINILIGVLLVELKGVREFYFNQENKEVNDEN